MKLAQIPLFDRLAGCQRVLLAGAGGGFDIFCGIPLYWALREAGKQVHLANLTFTSVRDTAAPEVADCMFEVGADTQSPFGYFPERALCQWLRRRGIEQAVFTLERCGVTTLARAYEKMVADLNVDAVVLIDGGTDSLMRGDEQGLGTPHEDMLSIAAVADLSAVPRYLVCLGFGIDAFHGVSHGHFLEGVAELIQTGGFLGSFSLVRGMPEVEAYLEAVDFANAAIDEKPSIVNASIASALEGQYGNVHRTFRTNGSTLWINPLMTIYWAFSLPAVAQRVLYLDLLKKTESYGEVLRVIDEYHRRLPSHRRWFPIPV